MSDKYWINAPQRDLGIHLKRLLVYRQALPEIRARYLDLEPWWKSWEAILDQALAEGRLGEKEGIDEARELYFRDAVAISGAVASLCQRLLIGSDAGETVKHHPFWNHQQRAWHALRAIEQGISWAGSKDWTSGRLPILMISDAGRMQMVSMNADPRNAGPIPYDGVVDQLSAFSETLIWRA